VSRGGLAALKETGFKTGSPRGKPPLLVTLPFAINFVATAACG
jgi:hypothetical protein